MGKERETGYILKSCFYNASNSTKMLVENLGWTPKKKKSQWVP